MRVPIEVSGMIAVSIGKQLRTEPFTSFRSHIRGN
jgi:hypothetical protein